MFEENEIKTQQLLLITLFPFLFIIRTFFWDPRFSTGPRPDVTSLVWTSVCGFPKVTKTKQTPTKHETNAQKRRFHVSLIIKHVRVWPQLLNHDPSAQAGIVFMSNPQRKRQIVSYCRGRTGAHLPENVSGSPAENFTCRQELPPSTASPGEKTQIRRSHTVNSALKLRRRLQNKSRRNRAELRGGRTRRGGVTAGQRCAETPGGKNISNVVVR